jgi:hypothetical protein
MASPKAAWIHVMSLVLCLVLTIPMSAQAFETSKTFKVPVCRDRQVTPGTQSRRAVDSLVAPVQHEPSQVQAQAPSKSASLQGEQRVAEDEEWLTSDDKIPRKPTVVPKRTHSTRSSSNYAQELSVQESPANQDSLAPILSVLSPIICVHRRSGVLRYEYADKCSRGWEALVFDNAC